MNIARLAIKRPILISSIVFTLLFVGLIAMNRLGIDMYPDVQFPYVVVQVVYPGAAPEEIENLITKPIEDEVSSISGLKRVSSRNMESVSLVIAQFELGVDVKYAEQQVKDKVDRIRRNLPEDIDEPLTMRYDPADMPIARVALSADLSPNDLYDLAKEEIKVGFQQVNGVASVQLIGGQRREIQVELDRRKLNEHRVSALAVANAIKNAGMNVPVGKHEKGATETTFRTIAQFTDISQISNAVVQFSGDVGNAISVKSLGTVSDGSKEKTTIGYLYAPVNDVKSEKSGFFGSKKKKIKRETKPALFLEVYKQSGSNTVAAVDGLVARINKLNESMKDREGKPKLTLIYDGAKIVRMNVDEVKTTILIGVALAIIVVYLFLGNLRSTFITGIALPNSLLGAFILMYIMGYTINVITLLALSLTVGLLVDDAIVVRENIFRKLEEGMHPMDAAEKGTTEVMLAVIATTMTIMAVFVPIGFLSGIVGQFFKQFGFTIVFAMAISLFDALTVAPFLSAYFAGKGHVAQNIVIRNFERFQRWMETWYDKIMTYTLEHPIIVIILTTVIFLSSIASMPFIKKNFMSSNEFGEFMVQIQMPTGTSLDGTAEVALKVANRICAVAPEMNKISIIVGMNSMQQEQANVTQFGLSLVDIRDRKRTAPEIKTAIRNMLIKEFGYTRPKLNEYSMGMTSMAPYFLNIVGNDLDVLDEYSQKLLKKIEKIPDLTDVDTSSEAGKPEFQVVFNPTEMQKFGIMPVIAGAELRYQIAGDVVGKLHAKGLEYDVRLRLKPEQRDLRSAFSETKIPNQMYRMVPLSAISKGIEKSGPSQIIRSDRSRVVQITANLAPDGAIGTATDLTNAIIKKMPPPKGVTYNFIGQSEDLKELLSNMLFAMILAVVFIYFILASLYESFITPVTILMALPPALSGAFLALFIFREQLNMFAMIGMIMLMGLVTKNSILLVDFALEGYRSGMTRKEAIYKAGMTRLRPILMTTFAMLAGTLPVALGIGEVSKFRMAMGIAIMGGLILSTFLTLVVVPAIFEYIDIFREWIESKFRPTYKKHEYNVVEEMDEEEEVVDEKMINDASNRLSGVSVPEEKSPGKPSRIAGKRKKIKK
ncbi:MAG TPA: efflux RND transporter permease subunit [Spirochaetota bacterium]|nr:efflux RND transporter permease subunit [Spirochaetota bacterium]HPV42905.1 efflux RND transporter permease subunit [Spirochaetota bacterium]